MNPLTCHPETKISLTSSLKWIVSHFGIGVNTIIADFGCGPGLYITQFADKNADVTGIDFSERSIRYAKETVAWKGLP